MHELRGEGDVDALTDGTGALDVALSAVPPAALSGARPDGLADHAADAGGGEDPPGDRVGRTLSQGEEPPTGTLSQGEEPPQGTLRAERSTFWRCWAERSEEIRPDTLGAFLTALVAEKRAACPDDDDMLLAVGMWGTFCALGRTCAVPPGAAEEWSALAVLVARRCLGWQVPR